MKAEASRDLARAWARHWRGRACPPPALLFKGEQDPRLGQHLEICGQCRQDLEQRREAPGFPDLAGLWRGQGLERRDPRPGEVWLTDPALGRWEEEGRYFRPPPVLIVPGREEAREGFTALLVHDEPLLATAADLPLAPPARGFAETWNPCLLPRGALLVPAGSGLDPRDLSGCTGARGAQPPSAGPGSLLDMFVRLERNTARLLEQAARRQGAEELEQDLGLPDPLALAQALRSRSCVLPRVLPGSAADLLCRCQPADDHLPLAAAQEGEGQVTAWCFVFKERQLRGIQPLEFRLDILELDGDRLLTGGRVLQPPPGPARFLFRWQGGGGLVPPLEGKAGCADREFWAMFPLPDPGTIRPGNLIVRCIVHD